MCSARGYCEGGGRTDVFHQPCSTRVRRVSRIQQALNNIERRSHHRGGHYKSIHYGASSSASFGFRTEVVFCFVEAEKNLAAAELDEVSAVVVAEAGGWRGVGVDGGRAILMYKYADVTCKHRTARRREAAPDRGTWGRNAKAKTGESEEKCHNSNELAREVRTLACSMMRPSRVELRQGGAASSWTHSVSPVLWAAAAHDATTATASPMKFAIAAAGDGVAVPGATGTLRRGGRGSTTNDSRDRDDTVELQ